MPRGVAIGAGDMYIQLMQKGKRDSQEFEVLNKNRLKMAPSNIQGVLRRVPPAHPEIVGLQPPHRVPRELRRRGVPVEAVSLSSRRLNRGSQWWKKVDHRFFRQVREEDLQTLEARTTSEELLQLKYPARKLQGYFQELIYPQHPALLNLSLLKVLFRREVRLEGFELYALATYAFRETE